MRILLINHTFPPASFAGSEICVLNQAKELQRLGHETAVFYRIHDSALDEYSIQTTEYEGIPTFALNHTYRCVRTFQEIAVNSAIAVRFAGVLRKWKPDIVHFHHLTNLSLSLVSEVKAMGIPAIMTLHDYWLLCQRGQLLKRDMSLCNGPSFEKCRTCLAPQLLRGNAQRFISALGKKFLRKKQKSDGSIDLLNLRHARIETGDRRFVAKTCFDLGEQAGETLMAHPPSQIRYSLPMLTSSVLSTSIGMHPSTYDQEGQGVRFEVLLGEKILFSRILNPKQNPNHRGWHPIQVELETSPNTNESLILRTTAESERDNRFCTAGWRKPIVQPLEVSPANPGSFDERKQQIQSLVYQAIERITEAVTAFSPQASEGILHRRNWVQHVFDEVDLFISPSRFLRDFFIQHGVSPNKILYLDNGFQTPPVKKAQRRPGPIRFGYIGTWIPSKGVDLALQAFQSIDPTSARLVIHGFFPGYDGFENYESYMRSLSSPAVEWRGKYSMEETDAILADMDCLIMPSIWWENSPLTIHEAFLAGVPIITADVGGMAELVENGGGRTFQHRNAESLHDVVMKIIANPTILDDLRRTIPDVQSLSGQVTRLVEIYTQHRNPTIAE